MALFGFGCNYQLGSDIFRPNRLQMNFVDFGEKLYLLFQPWLNLHIRLIHALNKTGICNLWCSNITKKEKKKESPRGLDQRLEKETKRIVLLNKMKWQSKTFISSFRNHNMQFLYSISLFQYPCPTLTEPLISVQPSLLLGYTIDFERP